MSSQGWPRTDASKRPKQPTRLSQGQTTCPDPSTDILGSVSDYGRSCRQFSLLSVTRGPSSSHSKSIQDVRVRSQAFERKLKANRSWHREIQREGTYRL